MLGYNFVISLKNIGHAFKSQLYLIFNFLIKYFVNFCGKHPTNFSSGCTHNDYADKIVRHAPTENHYAKI